MTQETMGHIFFLCVACGLGLVLYDCFHVKEKENCYSLLRQLLT